MNVGKSSLDSLLLIKSILLPLSLLILYNDYLLWDGQDGNMAKCFESYINKKVFIRLKNGRCYSGLIKDADIDFVTMNDKYNKLVSFSNEEVSLIQQEN